MTTTLQRPSTTEPYLAAFRACESDLPAGLHRQRQAAIARFGEIGFPTERNEDWKFTNLAGLAKTTFVTPPSDSAETQSAYRQNLIQSDGSGVTVACVNANAPFLLAQSKPLPPGVVLTSLSEALRTHGNLVTAHLGRYADVQQHPFVALNTAFWRDGVFLYVPAGVVVEEPIHLWHQVAALNAEGPYLWYRRVLLILERGAQATVAEQYHGMPIAYGTNAVVEVVLHDGATLDHYKSQTESADAYHFSVTQASVARDANFSTHSIGLGGKLVRNEVRVVFTGENAEATVNGLYRADGSRHVDNHTVIDHAMPHCRSHELYKGILADKARGVFNGKIFVRQDAQKTDAKQTNQTLLLSDDATINSKPQLEIYADDVKCTHGATVGQLDEQQLFYLRSRGIADEQAKALLTFAFANDIVSRIKVASMRDRLERTLLESAHLPRLADLEE